MKARDNPFRTDRVLRVRYRLDGTTWPEFLRRCAVFRFRGALVGPHGSGKTTLLEDLDSKFCHQGFGTRFIRLDADHRRFAPGLLRRLSAELTTRDILLFDGAEQMGALPWHWFKFRTRRAAGLIITVHHAGRLPTLWECRTSPILLAEIAGDLLGQEPILLQTQAGVLYHKYRGNVREALREWYDLVGSAGPETNLA